MCIRDRYYSSEIDKAGKKTYAGTVIPYRGAWLEYEIDANGIMYVHIDKSRKLPMTVLIRALGVETRDDIYALLGEDEKLTATFDKDDSELLATQNHSCLLYTSIKSPQILRY